MFNDKIGEVSYNKFGSKMTIIEYLNARNVKIVFNDSNIIKNVYYQWFKDGVVKNPYDKTIYNVGFIGIGNYKISINSKHTPYYMIWHSMLQRCYSKIYQQKHPAYLDCSVCEE